MADTIPVLFERQAAAAPQRPLMYAKRDGAYRPISWAEVRDDVHALAAWLVGRGVAAGDRVLLFAENRPEWGVADLAIQSVGAWTVPIYPSLTAPEIQRLLEDCEPVGWIVCGSDRAAIARALQPRCTSLRWIVAIDAPGGASPMVAWADALRDGRAQGGEPALSQRRAQLQPTDPATIIYTSGTTGDPKGVQLSHRNFLSNVDACLSVLPIGAGDLHLSFLPLCHVFERMAGWYLMLRAGAAVAYAESMDALPENMREVRPTIMLGVPRFFEKLRAGIEERMAQLPPPRRRVAQWAAGVGRAAARHRLRGQPVPWGLRLRHGLAERLAFRKLKAGLGGRLRFFVAGGAALSPELGEFFFAAGVTILEGYGLTETSPVIAVNRLPVPRFGSVGQAIPGVEVRVADDGEILTRGPHVMQGYYRKPAETAEVLRDGWFHTGDIGRIDLGGFLCITDRKKDLIKTAGGKFVAPQKLENRLASDPYIAQAFVYGEGRPYCVALLVPNPQRLQEAAREQGIAGESIAELVRDERMRAFYWARVQQQQADLPSFEQVKKITLLAQEFTLAGGELTPTLKLKRQLVAKKCASTLEALYRAVPSSAA